MTSAERAAEIIVNDRICLNPKLGIFTVVGVKESHVVKLFPTQSWSCPAKTQCYHLRSAELA